MEPEKINGVFETMRCFQGKIIHLDWHLERMAACAKLADLKLPATVRQLENEIYSTVKLNRLYDARVRLTLSRLPSGAEISVFAKEYRPFSPKQYKAGFSAAVSSWRQDECSLSARIKSTNRSLYNLSLEQVRKKGFDEAIILNRRGNICEGARSNIFFKVEGELFTPALSNGCLAGVTRRLIFTFAKKLRLKTYEGNFILEDLGGCDEAFLTNSMLGVMPLTRLADRPIADGKIGKTSESFLKNYQDLLKK